MDEVTAKQKLRGLLNWLTGLTVAFLTYPEKAIEDNQTRTREKPRRQKTSEDQREEEEQEKDREEDEDLDDLDTEMLDFLGE